MTGKVLVIDDAGNQTRDWIRKFNQYVQTLEKRYEECKGLHKKPLEDGTCGHCYRRLAYETPVTDRILSERESLHPLDRPCDAAWLMDKRKQEIGIQKTCDWLDGIDKIKKELEGD